MTDLERVERLIELGCGERPNNDLGRDSIAIGVDLNIEALQTARRSAERWSLVCADARALPIQSSSISHISLRAVLHHLVPIQPILAELARVLCVDGSMTIIDGVALSNDEASLLDAELARAGLDAEPIYGFDLRELTEQIEQAGLRVEQLDIDGTATFATPPFVSKTYESDRFILSVCRP